MRCYIDRDMGRAPRLVLKLSRYFGCTLECAVCPDGRRYLCAVIWYPRGRKLLGYAYPSMRYL
jgi:hypothetical protein